MHIIIILAGALRPSCAWPVF